MTTRLVLSGVALCLVAIIRPNLAPAQNALDFAVRSLEVAYQGIVCYIAWAPGAEAQVADNLPKLLLAMACAAALAILFGIVKALLHPQKLYLPRKAEDEAMPDEKCDSAQQTDTPPRKFNKRSQTDDPTTAEDEALPDARDERDERDVQPPSTDSPSAPPSNPPTPPPLATDMYLVHTDDAMREFEPHDIHFPVGLEPGDTAYSSVFSDDFSDAHPSVSPMRSRSRSSPHGCTSPYAS